MVVDLTKLEKVLPSEASGIETDSDTVPLGPVSGHSERATLFDPLWGYISRFGQSFGFQYDDAKTYGSVATFTIVGSFTREAVFSMANPDVTDTEALTSLMNKFVDLEVVFDTAAAATKPADFTLWGTVVDDRCIALPQPFLDKTGNTVRALPVSLSIMPGRWAQEIQYRAVLREAKFPKRKVVVNGVMLDGAVVSIDLPSPILFRKKLQGCAGELIQVQNYTVLGAEVTGKMSRKQTSGDLFSQDGRNIMQSMWNDTVNVSIADGDAPGGAALLLANFDPDGGGNIDAVAEAYQDVVTVKMKAKI